MGVTLSDDFDTQHEWLSFGSRPELQRTNAPYFRTEEPATVSSNASGSPVTRNS